MSVPCLHLFSAASDGSAQHYWQHLLSAYCQWGMHTPSSCLGPHTALRGAIRFRSGTNTDTVITIPFRHGHGNHHSVQAPARARQSPFRFGTSTNRGSVITVSFRHPHGHGNYRFVQAPARARQSPFRLGTSTVRSTASSFRSGTSTNRSTAILFRSGTRISTGTQNLNWQKAKPQARSED